MSENNEQKSTPELSRRELLKMGTALSAGLLLPGLVSNPTKASNSEKWWREGTLKTRDFSALETKPPQGMSSRQIKEHLGLYKKYVSSLNKVEEQEKASGITHDTLLNKGFAYGGTVLHELYFANLSSSPKQLQGEGELINALERTYGAFEGFTNNFKTAGAAARGWVILGLNLTDGTLNIYGMDAHNEGSMLGFIWPVLVMDVYEHAYMIDHGTNKASYIDGFMNNIDWTVCEKRFGQGLGLITNSSLIV
ncbi:MAG: Fe-Mn family superoxide dismutase [Candidatus Caenarcaniphilales bacterium]|nr:Fe-Mn family superoxide dismutase [Candidatus Caenarcaniphilales bacterium]